MVRDNSNGAALFVSRTAHERFAAAYQRQWIRWPSDRRFRDSVGFFGTTRVNIAGPEDGAPVVLLPGYGATSMAWTPLVASLARRHTLYAIDLPGDAGLSVGTRRYRTQEDLTSWLAEVLDDLALTRTVLCGHSYGAWLALRFTLRQPSTVRGLALLDPTTSFASMRAGYLWHALPALFGPSETRTRRFLSWETRGTDVDPGSFEVAVAAGGSVRAARPVTPHRAGADELRSCATPTLVLLGDRSRAHDQKRVQLGASQLPHVTITTVHGATHHSMPSSPAAALADQLGEFLDEVPR